MVDVKKKHHLEMDSILLLDLEASVLTTILPEFLYFIIIFSNLIIINDYGLVSLTTFMI